MKRTDGVAILAGVVVGALLALAGQALSPLAPSSGDHRDGPAEQPQASEPPPAGMLRAADPVPTGPAPPDAQLGEQDIRQLRASFLSRWGRPAIAPPDLPDRFREDAVRTVMQEVFEAHGGAIVRVECDHYPCIAMGLVPTTGMVRAEDLPLEYENGYVVGAAEDASTGGLIRLTVALPAQPLDDLEQRLIKRRKLHLDVTETARVLDLAAQLQDGEAP